MKKIILGMMLFVSSAQAIDPTLQYEHDWSHIGGAFMVQTVAYQTYRKGLKLNKGEALLFSLITTTMITTVYSLTNNVNPNDMGRTMGMNAIGAGLAAGISLTFDF